MNDLKCNTCGKQTNMFKSEDRPMIKDDYVVFIGTRKKEEFFKSGFVGISLFQEPEEF